MPCSSVEEDDPSRIGTKGLAALTLLVTAGIIIAWGDLREAGGVLGDLLALVGGVMAAIYILARRRIRQRVSLFPYVFIRLHLQLSRSDSHELGSGKWGSAVWRPEAGTPPIPGLGAGLHHPRPHTVQLVPEVCERARGLHQPSG